MSGSERLLTTVQAAEQLCIPAATLRAIRRRREIAAVNVGTARRPIWRYRQADLDRWVRARTVPVA